MWVNSPTHIFFLRKLCFKQHFHFFLVLLVFLFLELFNFSNFFCTSLNKGRVELRNALKIWFCFGRIPGSGVSSGSPEERFDIVWKQNYETIKLFLYYLIIEMANKLNSILGTQVVFNLFLLITKILKCVFCKAVCTNESVSDPYILMNCIKFPCLTSTHTYIDWPWKGAWEAQTHTISIHGQIYLVETPEPRSSVQWQGRTGSSSIYTENSLGEEEPSIHGAVATPRREAFLWKIENRF